MSNCALRRIHGEVSSFPGNVIGLFNRSICAGWPAQYGLKVGSRYLGHRLYDRNTSPARTRQIKRSIGAIQGCDASGRSALNRGETAIRKHM